MPTYVRYGDDVETVAPDEDEVFAKILDAMSKGARAVQQKEGHAYRASHAKAHAIAYGELTIGETLAPEMAQGLFAQPGRYAAVVRLAHVPGELLDDRKVSPPRGLSLKVLDVKGPTITGSTQDWVLDTGEAFIASGVKTFLQQITMTEAAAAKSEGLHAAVSAVSRVQNAALNAVGLNSANLDFYGHPKLDPLTETYYSQAPIRYGDYIAKLRVRPLAGADAKLDDIPDQNGLRTLVTSALRQRGLEFAVEVQLCTDLERMPVEDAHATWSQEESPYREVARLSLPAQDTWSAERAAEDDRLSFCPAHSLQAHRPLGSIMRARMAIYDIMAKSRAEANGLSLQDPVGRSGAAA